MRSRALGLLVVLITVACSAGCALRGPSRPVDTVGPAAPGAGGGGGSGGGVVATTSEAWSFVLPDDGSPNADGTVSAFVVDGATGATVGEVDFFTSTAEPIVDGAGRTLVADALIGVSGAVDPLDASSPEDAQEVDLAAADMVPGATTTVRAGAFLFAVTIEQANVDAAYDPPLVDASSLVVRVDVTLAG